MTNLILTMDVGLTDDDLHPFLASLRAHVPDAHLHMFTDRASGDFETDGLDFSSEVVSEYLGAFKDMGQRPETARFFLFRRYLEANGGKYDRVLLTDCLDAFFQADPFDTDVLTDAVAYSSEDQTIAHCNFNRSWLSAAEGDAMVDELGGYGISCAGVTLGRTERVLVYVREMCGEIFRSSQRVMLSEVKGVEQGVHNFLVRKKPPAGSIVLENHKVTSMLHHTAPGRIALENDIVRVDGGTPALVHQYRIHHTIAQALDRLYPR